MIFFGFLLLLGAAVAITFLLPLGPAPAALAIGIGATLAMLLVMRLADLLLRTVARRRQADLSGPP